MLLKTAKKTIIAVVGGTLILIGIVGWIMPVLPGWPLFFVGLAVLGSEFVWAKRLLKHVKAKTKAVANFMGVGSKEPTAGNITQEPIPASPLTPEITAPPANKTAPTYSPSKPSAI